MELQIIPRPLLLTAYQWNRVGDYPEIVRKATLEEAMDVLGYISSIDRLQVGILIDESDTIAHRLVFPGQWLIKYANCPYRVYSQEELDAKFMPFDRNRRELAAPKRDNNEPK